MMPAELAVGNIVRRVLHVIREEDFSSTAASFEGLTVSEKSDDEDDVERKGGPLLSAAALAAAARSTLRPRSLQTILEDGPAPVVPSNSSSGGDSEGKSKCWYYLSKQ
jgi:translation initiation factor eIF-2B subunit beta